MNFLLYAKMEISVAMAIFCDLSSKPKLIKIILIKGSLYYYIYINN